MIHGINMKGINRHKFAFLLTFCFILSSISPLVIADDETGLTSTINSNWLGDENHGYIIKFNRAPSADELGDNSEKTTQYIGKQEIRRKYEKKTCILVYVLIFLHVFHFLTVFILTP